MVDYKRMRNEERIIALLNRTIGAMLELIINGNSKTGNEVTNVMYRNLLSKVLDILSEYQCNDEIRSNNTYIYISTPPGCGTR